MLQIAADARWWGASSAPRRRFGIPVGCPFDRESWSISTLLVRAESAIEIGPFGGIFVAEADITIGLAGARRRVTVDGAPAPDQGRLILRKGQRFEIGAPSEGARSYVGFVCEEGRGAVSRGDLLVSGGGLGVPMVLAEPPRSVRDRSPLAAMAGPQCDLFGRDETEAAWRVTMDADRLGIRLEGEALVNGTAATAPSEPQTVGTLQVPPSGQPILIGPDGPTLGGYPKIAVVVSAHLDRLGQLKPGDEVMFRRVSRDEAVELRHAARVQFQRDTLWRHSEA